MEDIFKFLLVIGIIAVGFVRQAKKEANKKTGGSPVMPMPDERQSLSRNYHHTTKEDQENRKKTYTYPKATPESSKHRQCISRTG